MRRGFNPKQAIAFGWVFTVVGTLAVLFGIGWGVRSLALQVGAERTTGTVVEMRRGRLSRTGGGRAYFPIVEYQVDGEKYRIEGKVGSSGPMRHRVGDKLEVIYPTDRPADGRLNTFLTRWAFPLLSGGIGSVFLALGVFMVRTQRRRAW